MAGIDILRIANNILKMIGIDSQLVKPEEINIRLFVVFYQALFNDKLDLMESSNSEKDNFNSISLIIDTLSKNILHASLSHIKPEDIIKGSEVAIINLLEIFQGLAECILRQENKVTKNNNSEKDKYSGKHKKSSRMQLMKNDIDKKLEKESNFTNADVQYSQLKMRIKHTEKQVDNLTTLAEEAINLGSDRQKYLHKKMKELLCRSGGENFINCSDRSTLDTSDRLQEYVNDHNDQLVLMQTKMHKKSQMINIKQPCKDESELILLPFDDDLTNVTINDVGGPRYDSSFNHDDVSQASNETYVLESSKEADKHHSVSFNDDVKVKDAWAQVNKDLIHQRYENEFLDMLLEEGEILSGEKRKCDTKGQLLRDFSQRPVTTRPLSAFDELLQTEELGKTENWSSQGSDSSRLQSKSIRQMRGFTSNNRGEITDKGGFMRPVVKHLDTHRMRKLPTNYSTNVNAIEASDQDMITKLLDSFPGLQLSEHTIRNLWNQAAQQASTIQKTQKHFFSKLVPSEQRVEEARRRQHLLSVMLRKEVMHQVRLQEKQEERQAYIATHSIKEKQRQQSARAKRYLDEFSNRMKARMMNKQAREEQVFRTMFKAALKIQRERINEMRRYTREVKDEQLFFHQKDLDSLENYYRDRFSMLADSLRSERKQLKLQDKSQELALAKLKRQMRTKLENDIRTIQDSLVQSQHELYFRELDAHKALSNVAQDRHDYVL